MASILIGVKARVAGYPVDILLAPMLGLLSTVRVTIRPRHLLPKIVPLPPLFTRVE